jgi:hypothetical protein
VRAQNASERLIVVNSLANLLVGNKLSVPSQFVGVIVDLPQRRWILSIERIADVLSGLLGRGWCRIELGAGVSR